MKKTALILSFLLVTVAACAQPADPVPTPQPDGETACNPSTDLIGKSRDIIASTTFAGPVRVIGPGDAVTMDYSPNRLNLIVDDKGIIIGVRCG